MSEELKPCDHCGEEDGVVIWKHERGYIVECGECGASSGVYPTRGKAAEAWNRRPAEETLKAENDELRYIVEQFEEWYNENGCPKYFDPDFPCSAETEYKNDPETEGDFDERDCWKNEADHGCWVEYYRWKFRQENNTPDAEKGGDDEP